MPQDWSDGALEERLARFRDRYAADRFEPQPASGVSIAGAGLAAKCLVAGVSATVLYVWPVLLLTHIFFNGPSDHVYWSILAGSAALLALVFALLATLEERYWGGHWQDAGDHADPPYWK